MSAQEEAIETVTERLERVSRRWWAFSLLVGVALTVTLSLASLMFFVLVDAVVVLPRVALLVLFTVWAGLTGLSVLVLIYRTLRSQRGLETTARRLEMELPELGSHLINLVQLSGNQQADDPFYRAAAAEAAGAVKDVPLERATQNEGRWRRLRLCLHTSRDCFEASALLTVILVLAWGMHTASPRWSSSLDRLLHPWAFVPSVGSVQIEEVTPGNTTVLRGASLEVSARIGNPDGKPYPGTLYVRREGEPEEALSLLPDDQHQKYVAALPQVLAPLHYRLEIGGSQTQLYTVAVQDTPTIAEVEVTYHYPPYLNRAKETVTQKHGDLHGPQYTRADVRIRASVPIVSGFLRLEDREIKGWVEKDGRTVRFSWQMKQTGTYTVHLTSDAGFTDPEPRVNRVEVVPDAPPTVQLLDPSEKSKAIVGSHSLLAVRAADDHGLGEVRVEWKSAEQEGNRPGKTVATWSKFPLVTSAAFSRQLFWDAEHFKPGQMVLIRAIARDRRNLEWVDDSGARVKLGPQEVATPWRRVRILSAQAQASEKLAQLDVLRKALFKVLQQQIKARIETARAPREEQITEAIRLAGLVRADQVKIHKATVEVVEAVGQTDDAEQLVIKRVANKLAFGDMLEAVRQAEALSQAQVRGDLDRSARTLTPTQDRIIDVLRRLLNDIRQKSAGLLGEMDKRPGGDLPSDVQNKLRDLQSKLEEFLKQQKKVIEASENLAKMPVEDFTEKEEQLLNELAATEEEWSRFMTEKHTDLSKLPEQDFANPSLLEEMVEVQTELKMAEGALTKKAADIAVPLEQLGAEMAKELMTNIEKWLPDTPDRERWSQEEPLTDEMKEAPMAELPGELEDLIGELMEEEEDLFDELEDVSSSWADSLDKGAGWDAMDGPISNMSAKGVTGNRLPNTSEIGGRSGEGRQGKASGEFVGDTAVGKGGRKTPSRLTPDPNVKGQIKDQSKDPVGGATGGGKESGQGGEGLEGPVPERPERRLQRLTAKQAELRNKAESIDLKFKVLNYHRTDLKKMKDLMAAVENDLRSGRYRNALRHREVLLGGLGQIKKYLEGEFKVRQDRTDNLPTDIQKQILGSLQEASPAGWEELNQRYFERLATPGKR